jgi:brefeldin A-resistance guanine nucleotide exchange factor 1
MRVPVILHGISSFEQDILERVAVPTIKGLARCISDPGLLRNELTVSPDFWSILQRLHQHTESAPLVFELLRTIIESVPPIVTADNYESAVGLANDFISAGSVGYIEERQRDAASRRSKGVKPSKPSENEVVARGVKAIGLIYHLTNRVPTLIKQSHLEEREAWSAYWSPVFQSLSAQCINPCRDIRHHAVSTLQRCLLSVHIDSTDDKEWTAIFDQVLFPLILLLLKPEVYHSDPLGMSETRVQAATLVCKIFLRYLDQLPNREGMLDLWLKILDILDRMMNSGQGDSLVRGVAFVELSRNGYTNYLLQAEAIPESLKNILLVMADGGHLVPPSQDSSKEPIWTETKKRLERFLPDLFKEIFPEDLNEKPAAVSAASSPISPRDDANATDASVGESQPMPGQSESEGEVEVIKPETKTD